MNPLLEIIQNLHNALQLLVVACQSFMIWSLLTPTTSSSVVSLYWRVAHSIVSSYNTPSSVLYQNFYTCWSFGGQGIRFHPHVLHGYFPLPCFSWPSLIILSASPTSWASLHLPQMLIYLYTISPFLEQAPSLSLVFPCLLSLEQKLEW